VTPQNNNPDDFNFNDPGDNSQSPFGNFDPGSLPAMFSEMFSGSAFGFSPQAQGPMEVAQRVAADIAARDIEQEEMDNLENEDQPQAAQDPMAEIMQLMQLMATPGTTKKLSVDSSFSARCEQIYPAAQSYIANNTQSQEVVTLPLVVTDRVTWTKDYISSMEGPLNVASKSLNPAVGLDSEEENETAPGFDIQSMIAQTVAPMMFGVQAGTMLGFLSHRAYGDDDVLLPTQLPSRVGIIASAVQKFCKDWSVPTDEAILYFLILQTIRAQIRNHGWLTARLDDLCTRYVAAYELNPYKLEELMSDVDMSSQESMMSINVTPEQMFEALRTPMHDILDEEIGRISSLHDAYVEWVLHKDLEPLLPNFRIIQEARKRITVTTSDADRFVEQLFGVAVSLTSRDHAAEFIEGVVERGGENKLHQLWYNEELLPTEAEFAAPGLWLARLELL
jgi:putative hydrolase